MSLDLDMDGNKNQCKCSSSNTNKKKRMCCLSLSIFHKQRCAPLIYSDNNTNDKSKECQYLSWKITIHTLGSKYTRKEQDEKRHHFTNLLSFPGPARMNLPHDEYLHIREVELNAKGSPLHPRRGSKSNNNNNNGGGGGAIIIPEHDSLPPLAVYFGRILEPSSNSSTSNSSTTSSNSSTKLPSTN